MQDNTDYTMLYRLAKYYYEDKLSQSEIAQKEHISRPHISRLLDKARECGIVDIKVSLPPELQISKTRQDLKEKLCLQDAIIAFSPTDSMKNNRRASMNIATAAAHHLPNLIAEAKNIGIGWGFTMYQTSLQLSYCNNCEDITCVPLVGISGENNPYLQINTIVDRFAEKLGSKSLYTNIPAIRESNMKLAQVEKERYIKIQKYWDRLDAAIIGLGVPPMVGKFLISEVSQQYKDILVNSKTVGDILSQFFFEDGTVFDLKADYEQVSLPINNLKNIKTVICLAGGLSKVDGIISAARNGFFNILITDSITAKHILEKV
ncbi:MAG: sugar-binding domain-containing protein [Ruminiclostridium sp.]|nr:sugar-binding domain-containing protein [Ruminiclostridium sp.]